MRIRPGAGADLEAVLALDRASEAAPHWSEQTYRRALAGEDERCVFIAREDGLRGFAVGRVVAQEAELESVAVAANSRRRGVGRELCRRVIAWAVADGATAVHLEVRAGSDGAIALYAGLGFLEVGRRKGYYRDPEEDALLLRLEL